MYYSEHYIEEFYQRCVQQVKQITDDYEIVFVNDGSPDNAKNVAVGLFMQDKHVKVVDLSRNFGHHKAMLCGLDHAQGAIVFLIDCDLEEAPEWLDEFYKKMNSECCDVVYGIQVKRKGYWFERWTGAFAYKFFNAICNIYTDENITTARLMTNKYVKALGMFSESEPVFSGICQLAGFEQIPVMVEKEFKGNSSYSLKKKLSIVLNMVTSFSSEPLKYIFYTGLAIFIVALFYTLYLFIIRVFLARPLEGWTSIMMSIWLLGGLIILFIGIVGLYLSRIFIEVKGRPNTIIKELYSHDQ